MVRALMARIAGDAVVRAGFQMDADVTRKSGRAFSRRWQARVGEVLRQAEREGGLAEGVSWCAVAASVVAATAGLRVLAASDETWCCALRVDQVRSVLLSAPEARQAPRRVAPTGTGEQDGCPRPC
ncbi:hypothetical protein [Streptomyces guryensis]|uniref:Uncharacterized protein n=1 Tax=Streptomyces guryensis TaxID=2886947 RepID=A0A9Q3VPR6_9ACTN|nr:hypothetical protein [Streptomyces guryensis]MCD9874750.1 hypothetical protein [Streptomyces guryensis]